MPDFWKAHSIRHHTGQGFRKAEAEAAAQNSHAPLYEVSRFLCLRRIQLLTGERQGGGGGEIIPRMSRIPPRVQL